MFYPMSHFAQKYYRCNFIYGFEYHFVDFRWLSHYDTSPGFSQEAFHHLQERCRASHDGALEVALMVDAMGIRKQVVWDSKRQCHVGYVDYGAGPDPLKTEEASEALVFMVVAVKSHWKEPIAYFLTRGVPGYALAQLVIHAMERLYEIGVSVISLTLDGHQSNQAAVKILGASLKGEVRSTFKHPSNPNIDVCVFFDACHMIKLIRNSLHAYGEPLKFLRLT